MDKHLVRLGYVANGAVSKRSRMPLQFHEFDRIVVLPAWRDGVGAVVTAGTIDPAVSNRLAV